MLGIVFTLGIAGTAYMLMDSWAGASWVLTSAVGAVVSALALLRARQPVWTAIAGLAVVACAVGVSASVDLPQEPGPTTALALAVLVGSAIRVLPPARAAGIALASIVVMACAWISGGGAVVVLAALLCISAIATGLGLRVVDRGGRR